MTATIKIGNVGSIEVSWPEAIRVVGLHIGIRRLNSSDWGAGIQVYNSSIGQFYYNIEDGPNLNVTTLQIGTQILNVTGGLERRLWFTTNDANLKLCVDNEIPDASDLRCLDAKHMELFTVNEHNDCDTPDSPHDAYPTTFPSATGIVAKFTCKDGHRLKSNYTYENEWPICGENGQWSNSDYRPCEPEMCAAEKLEHAINLYQPALVVHGDRAVASIGTKAHLQCTKPRNDSFVVCEQSGEWTQVPKDCFEDECQPQSSNKLVIMSAASGGAILSLLLILVALSWRIISVKKGIRCKRLIQDTKRVRYSKRNFDPVQENIYDCADNELGLEEDRDNEYIYMQSGVTDADVGGHYDDTRVRKSHAYNKRQSNLIKL